jgi:NAD(P)-dependent dehydrogenase (short-subunit alcohol dehydrogenase family)
MRSEADSVFLMVNDAWPFLRARGGSIINFASTAALRAQNTDGGVAHSAAKGAVLAMSRVMAFEGAEHKIRCNTISPGFVATNATARIIDSALGRELVERKILLKRIGQPDDIAWCCVYLASDESSWVTGANFTIDGGMMAT